MSENTEKVNDKAAATIRQNTKEAVTKAVEGIQGDMAKRGFDKAGVDRAIQRGVEDAYRNIK